MRRFYSAPDKTDTGQIALGPDETRHLRDVLRLRPGDNVSVFDGFGHEYLCRVAKVSRAEAVLEILHGIEPPSPESPLDLNIAAAILPGDKFEITIEKAAELGVRTLQPIFTRRCEVKPGGGAARLERWRKIVIGSAKQSGRATLMKINEPIDVGALFQKARVDQEAVRILFSERDGMGIDAIRPATKMLAVFGPKGGWDDSELASAKDAGFTLVTFGGRIMRAETAAIAMTAILQHRFGDVN